MKTRTLRTSLLTSAGLCIALAAGSAQAATDDPIADGTFTRPLLASGLSEAQDRRISIDNVVREAQDHRISINDVVREAQDNRIPIDNVVREAQVSSQPTPAVDPTPEIVIAAPNTTVTDRDPNNITGVGQMIVAPGGNGVNLCTGTLINPRTMIFAAHCVNTSAATAYGAASGGTPIGFGFNASNNSTIAGHAAGTSPLLDWFLPGPGQFKTDQSNNFYNASQVRYNPLSTSTNSCVGPGECFLIGDIATATLDTPTRNIPTWALLFSQLPDPGAIGKNGTGYHVVIDGYGLNGTSTTGTNQVTNPIDFRRRLAENMLGGLASLGDFESFLFTNGTTDATNPQNLYWIDFDDIRRGTAQAAPYDVNVWRDNALPKEGMTAGGDSGGPLILDAGQPNSFAKSLVIGVLSGGYTTLYGPVPNGLGTAAFYQPLYLYWDWIVANNPYHYVSTVAGNGNWTDPNHWVTNMDPAYQSLINGVLTNGLPTAPGAGNTVQDGFGQVCVQGPSVFGNVNFSDCLDVATNTETFDPNGHPIGQDASTPGGASNDLGTANLGTLTNGANSTAVGNATSDPDTQNPAAVAPPATLANGLAGATGFVPNNVDPVRTTGAIGKYFDVTLTAAGTTTLDSAVTVDRFAIGIGGGNAVLDIKSTGSLTSLIDITQTTGTIHANGALITPGDYLMLTGGLDGTGTVTANFFTNMAGTIAPGTAGTIGTLNFKGNLILASASTFNLDLGANGTSDKIAVAANGAGTGMANVGGRLLINSPIGEIRGNTSFTILTAAGGVSGKFIDLAPFSAILTPKLVYSATAVQLQIQAGTYSTEVDRNNPIQAAFALLLDRNRGQASNYDRLYGPLDLQNQATIRAQLSGFAPADETLGQSLGIAAVDNWSGVIRNRIDGLNSSEAGGTLARYGAPTQVAANGINSMAMGGMGAMGFGADIRSDAQQPMVEENALPDTMNGFLAGGYLTGDGSPMNGTGLNARDKFSGWYAAGGIETADTDSSVGIAFSYTRLDGTGAFPSTIAHANLYQGTLYGKANLGGINLDAMGTAGLLDLGQRRHIAFVGNTTYTIHSHTDNLVFVSEVGLSKDFDLGAVRVTPRAAGRASHIGFSRTAEFGGPMALMINRGPIDSVQARGGLTIAGTGTVKPFLNGTFVHDFMDRPAVFGANFVGGVGGNVLFALNSQDQDWAEVSGGLTYETGNLSFSASAETTIERQDVSSQAYRGSISFKF